jgi:ubiquinone/menaquinone biosynthesis C-methylase UbiE
MNEKRLKEFWNNEYKDPGMFGLSDEASADLQKFTRWLMKEYGKDVLRPDTFVLDAGCGNGRNLLWLNDEFRVRGLGFDIAEEAIMQAKKKAEKQQWGGKLSFEVRSIGELINLPDESVDVVLDMMSSHFLKNIERARFIKEVARVLKPQGVLFFKSFYAERDSHTRELLEHHAADEENAYIHPRLKVYEYVWTDAAIESSFSEQFTIMHKEASHKHHIKGKPAKRRSIVCYFEKK